MRTKLLLSFCVIGITLATGSAYADAAASLLGKWSGTDNVVTSRSLSLAKGDLNKAIQQVKTNITITQAQKGLCVANIEGIGQSKILVNNRGNGSQHIKVANTPCVYTDTTVDFTTDNNASFTCTYNATTMTCKILNSRLEQQAATMFHLTKQS
jgi:hypothetical protein